MRTLDVPSLVFLVAAILVALVTGSLEDQLLHHSDALHFGVFTLALAWIGAAASAPLWLAVWGVLGRERLAGGLDRIAVIAIVGGFALYAVDAWLFRARSPLVFAAIALACAAVGAGITWRMGSPELAGRIRPLARIVALGGVVAMSAGLVALRVGVPPLPAGAEPRHVVLIVVDGLPLQYLHHYDPSVPRNAFDGVLERGRLFANARTSAVWTNAFFSALYAGSTRWSFKGHLPEAPPAANLFDALQRHGVATRWIAFHSNGVPEGTRAGVREYRGLRSSFLTDRHAWLPRGLGLDYHPYLAVPAEYRGASYGPREAWVYGWLHRNLPTRNPYVSALLPEVESLHARAERSLTVFHTAVHLGRLLPIWQKTGEDPEIQGFLDRMSASNYVYEDSDEPIVAVWRDRQAEAVENTGIECAAFLDALSALPSAADTLVIVTADHGKLFDRQRIWYTYHPDEEVARVPMVVIGEGLAGRDERVAATPDLVRTLLTHLGVESDLAPGGQSLLEPARPGTRATVTRPDAVHRRWFLTLYRGDLAYRVNLHPDGDGSVVKLALEGLGVREIGRGAELLAELGADWDAALADYNLDAASIHAGLRGD